MAHSIAPPVLLRPLIEGDRDALADVWHASASLPGVGPRPMVDRANLRARIDRDLRSGWDVTVATLDRQIGGFVALLPQEAVLDQLFVDPRFQGLGVGGRLLEHAKAVLPRGFTLLTRRSNARACVFYESAGLFAYAEGLHPTSGDPVIHYRWPGSIGREAPGAGPVPAEIG